MAKSTTKKNTVQQDITDRYDQLIATGNIEGLLPFLQNEPDCKSTIFKKHILKMRRYLTAFTSFEKEQFRNGHKVKWGTRGDDTQCKIVLLTALSVLNLSDTVNFSNEIFLLQNYPTDQHVRAIVSLAKPVWIARAIEESFDKNDSFTFDYQLLRVLEADEIVEFSPRLFALSLASPKWFRGEKEGVERMQYLSTDASVLERDLPLLFDYETRLHDRWMFININTQQSQFWDFLLKKLLEEGKLDRRFFIEQSLLIQTKNWNNAIKFFFRKLLEAAGPTTGELIGYQYTLFSLLQESFPQVVNYGMEKIRQIHQHPEFDLLTWLDWLSPMLMRQDVATSAKKSLQIFDFFFKNMPDRRADLLIAAAEVFVVPDPELQQQAAKRILKNWKTDDVALANKLTEYQSLMVGNVRQRLAPILGEEEQNEPIEAIENMYRFQPHIHRLLEEKIVFPENWNEVLFLISRYLSAREPQVAELILHTYQTKRHLFPAGSTVQLKPLLKQIAYSENPNYVDFDNLMNGFLLQNTTLLRQLATEPKIDILKIRFPAAHIFKNLIGLTHRKIMRHSRLPLLCVPTHHPFWVEPETLVRRLIDYQDAGEVVNLLDLSVAISRMPRQNIAEAVELLPKLKTELRQLMEFCFGTSTQIFLKNENWQSKLLSLIGKAGEDTAQIAVWAVAARTYHHEDYFPEFEKTSLADAPNVTRPFSPAVSFVRHPRQEFLPSWKGAQPVAIPAYTDINVPLPPYQSLPLHLLYSTGLFKNPKNNWYWDSYTENALTFLHSLVPQHPDQLVWHCIVAKSGFKTLLQVVCRPENQWRYSTIFAFCMAFYNDDKSVRIHASEVLHFLIDQNRLDAARFGSQLGDFVYAKFNALSRLIECLERVKDVSPKHNAALFEILDSLFGQFYAHVKSFQQEPLPTHFKKMLECYVDLQVKTRREASAAALGCFQYLEGSAALKKLVSQIKSIKK